MHPTLSSPVVDERLIEAVWEVIEAMHPALRYGLHSPDPDTFGEGEACSIVEAENFTLDMLHEHGFIAKVCWQDRSSTLPRYLLLEVVPEGIAVTHPYRWYGKTIIGLPGMPTGTGTASPKITYLTVAEGSLVNVILFHLRK